MKRLIIFLSFISLSVVSQAQYKPFYNFAIGARAGSTGSTCGVTVKTFVGDQSAIEAIVGYYHNGISSTLLFEQHTSLFNLEELQFYFGGGVHYNNSTDYQNWIIVEGRSRSYEQAKNSYGFDAVVGLEYKFLSIPLAVSLDLKPAIEFNKFKSYSLGIDQGLGLKLTF